MDALVAGTRLKEVATREIVYQGCSVVHSDATGLVIEVQRTLSEGGNIETVVSQILLPWSSVNYVILAEQRT
ncbi:MAG TPA: hypothetical protein VMT87_06580 [Vicinamibacteria bacterium]|nr:hypothetical protein [Vicinamibacteria bacterium]